MEAATPYDVIVVGGGPAGLSAALVLGRCRRRVVVCDDHQPRNFAALAVHGFLTRDGISPPELRRLGRAELAAYGVELLDGKVTRASCVPAEPGPVAAPRFEVDVDGAGRLRGRRLLLATGVRDVLPPVPGAGQFYGRGVHHCPYCDGWEYRDAPLVAYGRGKDAVGLALMLRTWSANVTACTDNTRVAPEQRARLVRHRIGLREEKIMALEGGPDGRLARLVLAGGEPLACRALFFNTPQVQRSALPAMLGCGYKRSGHIRTGARQGTRVPGLYLAGDVDGDVQFAIVAAAEGATAAVAINRELQDEDGQWER